MRRICLVLFVLVCIMPHDARAQQAPVTIRTTVDGLPSNTINRIVRDSRGFLWFCTAEGLSRFDGYAFTNFGSDQGLPQSPINDFLETRTGEVLDRHRWRVGSFQSKRPGGSPRRCRRWLDTRSNVHPRHAGSRGIAIDRRDGAP